MYISFIKYIIYIILFLISFQGVAQKFADKGYYLIDSLDLGVLTEDDKSIIENSLKIYHETKTDTGKVNSLSIICENVMDQSWEKYQFFQYHLIKQAFHDGISPNERKSLKTALAHAVNNIGVIYVLEGKVVKGLSYFEESLALKEELNDRVSVAAALNNIGVFYYGQGDIPLSLEYYERSLKVMEELNDQSGMAASYEGIGIVHKDQGDLDLALSYYKKSLNIYLKLDNKIGIAQMYNNIGVGQKMTGNLKKAQSSYQNSLAIREEIQDKRGMAESLTNMGHLKQEDNNLEAAKSFYLRAFKLREEINDQRGLVFSYNDIGEIYLKQGKLTEAQEMGERGLKLAQSIQAPKIIQRNANLLCLVYEAQGKAVKALEMNRLSEHMKDSLYNESTQSASIRQQTKYEFDKARAIQDIEYENQLAIEHKEKEKQQIISYGAGIGLLLLGIFLIIVFNRLKVTRKQKKVIEFQKQIVDEKNQEITDSITYAKRIQEAILPTEKLVKQWLPDSFIFYKPKDIVAGDFYWMDVRDEYVLYAAADCTGHGVPGAMVSVICHNALNRVIRDFELLDPGKILDKIREVIEEQLNKKEDVVGISMNDIRDGMDIALCVLNTKNNTIQYAGANNPLWILRKGEEVIEEIKGTKQAVGKTTYPIPYQTHQVKLNKGDTVYVFSDGLADQFGGKKGKKLKYRPFKEMLIGMGKESMDGQLKTLRNQFNQWQGDLEQVDDVCVIGVRV